MRPRRAPEVVSHWRASERAKLARLHRVSPLSGSSNTPHVLRQYAASVGPASTARVSFCLFAAIVASSRRNRRCSLCLFHSLSRFLDCSCRLLAIARVDVAVSRLRNLSEPSASAWDDQRLLEVRVLWCRVPVARVATRSSLRPVLREQLRERKREREGGREA